MSYLGSFWISYRGYYSVCSYTMGFPSGASGKEPACLCRGHKRCRFDPWVGKIPWRKAWQPTPVFLPGESHQQRSRGATGHRVPENQTRLKRLCAHSCTFGVSTETGDPWKLLFKKMVTRGEPFHLFYVFTR